MEQPRYHLEGIVHTRAETPEDFDGPLDVIFLLLSKNKIEIQDVSISAILEQYLAYLDEMKRMDVEIASEFTAMASHLMLIKTKMLLSAAATGLAAAGTLYLLGGVLPGGKLGELLCLGGCALVGLAVYFLLTLALAVPEARLVVSLARGKGD